MKFKIVDDEVDVVEQVEERIERKQSEVRYISQHTTIDNPYKGKMMIVVGRILFWFGVVMAFSGANTKNDVTLGIGALLIITGFLIKNFGKFIHWWNWK